jgi:hypothetical protein
LSKEDQDGYDQLRQLIDRFTARANRDVVATNFEKIINLIRSYAIREDGADESRCLACGLVWLNDNALAISTRQLSKLLRKCKSAINFGFQSLGYGTVSITAAHASRLAQMFPFMKDNSCEMRQWTIRGLFGELPAAKRGRSIRHRTRATFPIPVINRQIQADDGFRTPEFLTLGSIRPGIEMDEDELGWQFLESDDFTGH